MGYHAGVPCNLSGEASIRVMENSSAGGVEEGQEDFLGEGAPEVVGKGDAEGDPGPILGQGVQGHCHPLRGGSCPVLCRRGHQEAAAQAAGSPQPLPLPH